MLIQCISRTVATYQTLLRAPRLQKFDPTGLKVIIVDEAHHAATPSYRHIPSDFNSGIKSPHIVEGSEDEVLNLVAIYRSLVSPSCSVGTMASRWARF